MAQEQNREGQEHYPEAMLDMGMPEEMSTYPGLAGANRVSAPMLEVRPEFELGEGLEEISRPEDLAQDS